MAEVIFPRKQRNQLWLWLIVSAIAIAFVIIYTKDKSYDENGGPEMERKAPGAKSGRTGEKEH
jgi:hypothetical protein